MRPRLIDADRRSQRHRLQHRQRPDDPDVEGGLDEEIGGPGEGEQAEEGADLARRDEGFAALLSDLLDDRLLAHRAGDEGRARRGIGDRRLVFQHERRGRGEIDRAENQGEPAGQEIEPGEGDAVAPAPGGIGGDGEERAEDRGLDADEQRQRPEDDQRAEFGEDEADRRRRALARSLPCVSAASAATIALIASGR